MWLLKKLKTWRIRLSDAFILPNNSNLSYAFPHDLGGISKVGGQWSYLRRHDTKKLHTFRRGRKDQNVRLGLWTSRSRQHFVCADFDYLPSGFKKWDDFYGYCVKAYGKKGFVFRSISNKVKVLFLVELPVGRSRMTSSISKNILDKLLKSDIEYADTSMFGMGLLFLYPPLVNGIQKFLRSNPKKHKIAKNMCVEAAHEFQEYFGEIPSEIFDNFIGKSVKREMFIRILMRQKGLVTTAGFDLPTTKIARDIGVDQKTVWIWREELASLGYLKCVDRDYTKGKKAMTYKFMGVIRKVVVDLFRRVSKGIKTLFKPKSFPDKINAGEWHEKAWELSASYVNNPKEFLEAAKKLSGINQSGKRRGKKFILAINNRLRYAGLPIIFEN